LISLHLRLGLPSGFFLTGLPNKTLQIFSYFKNRYQANINQDDALLLANLFNQKKKGSFANTAVPAGLIF